MLVHAHVRGWVQAVHICPVNHHATTNQCQVSHHVLNPDHRVAGCLFQGLHVVNTGPRGAAPSSITSWYPWQNPETAPQEMRAGMPAQC